MNLVNIKTMYLIKLSKYLHFWEQAKGNTFEDRHRRHHIHHHNHIHWTHPTPYQQYPLPNHLKVVEIKKNKVMTKFNSTKQFRIVFKISTIT
jgi:hypothetical protein